MEKTSQTKNSKQHDRLYIVKSTLIYIYIFRTSRLNQDKTKQNKTNTNKVR